LRVGKVIAKQVVCSFFWPTLYNTPILVLLSTTTRWWQQNLQFISRAGCVWLVSCWGDCPSGV